MTDGTRDALRSRSKSSSIVLDIGVSRGVARYASNEGAEASSAGHAACASDARPVRISDESQIASQTRSAGVLSHSRALSSARS